MYGAGLITKQDITVFIGLIIVVGVLIYGVIISLPVIGLIKEAFKPKPHKGDYICKKKDIVDICSICLDPLVESNMVVRSRTCGHMFCRKCINDCLTRNKQTCPLCRRHLSKSDLQVTSLTTSFSLDGDALPGASTGHFF